LREPRNRGIPHCADPVRNDGLVLTPQAMPFAGRMVENGALPKRIQPGIRSRVPISPLRDGKKRRPSDRNDKFCRYTSEFKLG